MKEWFKSKPYWLRGGIIGILINPFLFVISFFFGLSILTNPLMIPVAWLTINVMNLGLWGIPISIISGVILSGLLIGAFIGFIYGKIKSK